ncbi:hypothetical protein TWF281_008485 [Arthrobotrys megalospora]
MCSRLLLLPKELREEIFYHALHPTVFFYFRETDVPEGPEDGLPPPRVLISYEIGPIPRPLLLIHPMITDDVRCIDALLRPRMSKTIEASMEINEDEGRYWDKIFTTEPSSALLEIVRNARFIFDLSATDAADSLDFIARSPSLARNITYLAFHGFNSTVMSAAMANYSAETVAFFCFWTPFDRWISSKSMILEYANFKHRLGNPKLYSRLEYIFEESDPNGNEKVIGSLLDRQISMRPKCTRRRMHDNELDERGRAVFFLEQVDGTKTARRENVVIAYEFTEQE